MNKNPLSVILENDPELGRNIMTNMKLAYTDGALSASHKALIAMAIDAALGVPEGVRALAKQALAAGATREEIMETLRVVYAICGGSAMFAAAAGLEGEL